MLFEVGAVTIKGTSPKFLPRTVNVPIVGSILVTVNVAVVDNDEKKDVGACVAVINVLPLLSTFTSYSGRIETPLTQLEDEPVSVKLPLSMPVYPPIRSLFSTRLISVFAPVAIP